jgi:transcriptional regulator NrdR family protein
VDCSIFHGSIEDLTALVHPGTTMGLTSVEEPMKLDQDDLDAIKDLLSQGVGKAMLGATLKDPLKDDKVDTNVASTLRSLRRQVDMLANRSSADIAKAVVAALPQQKDAAAVSAAEVEDALRKVFAEPKA